MSSPPQRVGSSKVDWGPWFWSWLGYPLSKAGSRQLRSDTMEARSTGQSKPLTAWQKFTSSKLVVSIVWVFTPVSYLLRELSYLSKPKLTVLQDRINRKESLYEQLSFLSNNLKALEEVSKGKKDKFFDGITFAEKEHAETLAQKHGSTSLAVLFKNANPLERSLRKMMRDFAEAEFLNIEQDLGSQSRGVQAKALAELAFLPCDISLVPSSERVHLRIEAAYKKAFEAICQENLALVQAACKEVYREAEFSTERDETFGSEIEALKKGGFSHPDAGWVSAALSYRFKENRRAIASHVRRVLGGNDLSFNNWLQYWLATIFISFPNKKSLKLVPTKDESKSFPYPLPLNQKERRGYSVQLGTWLKNSRHRDIMIRKIEAVFPLKRVVESKCKGRTEGKKFDDSGSDSD